MIANRRSAQQKVADLPLDRDAATFQKLAAALVAAGYMGSGKPAALHSTCGECAFWGPTQLTNREHIDDVGDNHVPFAPPSRWRRRCRTGVRGGPGARRHAS